MSKRWSKLQKRLYNLIDSKIDFQIHCAQDILEPCCGPHRLMCICTQTYRFICIFIKEWKPLEVVWTPQPARDDIS